jgi:Spy/CpxP family protein refolding chaperone
MKFRMRSITLACVAVAMACMAEGVASAQEGARRGGGRGMNLISVVANAEVQKDLVLSPEQIAKVKEVTDAYTAAADAVRERQIRGAELQSAISKIVEEHKPKLAEAVSAEQMKRLEEIVLQARGAGALTEEPLAKALDLSDDQKAKIADANKQYSDKVSEVGGGGGDQARELRRERDEAIMGVLTQEQKDKLASMKGKEFDVSKLRTRRGGGSSN